MFGHEAQGGGQVPPVLIRLAPRFEPEGGGGQWPNAAYLLQPLTDGLASILLGDGLGDRHNPGIPLQEFGVVLQQELPDQRGPPLFGQEEGSALRTAATPLGRATPYSNMTPRI